MGYAAVGEKALASPAVTSEMSRSFGNISVSNTDRPIGSIFAHDGEIIRRIFVTVRDEEWNEIAPSPWSTPLKHETILIASRVDTLKSEKALCHELDARSDRNVGHLDEAKPRLAEW